MCINFISYILDKARNKKVDFEESEGRIYNLSQSHLFLKYGRLDEV